MPATQPKARRFATTSSRHLSRRTDLLGRLGVVAITAAVALSWLPVLDEAYGDNHEGRVFARLALQVRNLQQLGIVGSGYGTSWEPYQDAYAHHPPLATMASALVGAFPGDGEWQIRLTPYLLGLLAIPAAAWLLRTLELRWFPVLLALGLMATTGLYWTYGRIVWDLGPVLLLAAALARLRRDAVPTTRSVTVACTAAFLAVITGWLALAFAAALGLWLLAARRLDRATLAVGLSMLAALVVTLTFVIGLAGADELGTQARQRTTGGRLGPAEFLGRQWEWLTDLFPVWSLAMLPLALLAGMAHRSTRSLALLTTAVAIGWIVLFPDGSSIHDYWIFSLLVPFVIGTAALLDLALARIPRYEVLIGVVGGVAVAASLVHVTTSDFARVHVTAPLAAGELIEERRPPPRQRTAWVVSLYGERLLAFYWDMKTREVRRGNAGEVRAHDLVLLDRNRIPEKWLSRSVTGSPVASRGSYLLVKGADLQAALVDPPAGDGAARPAIMYLHPTCRAAERCHP